MMKLPPRPQGLYRDDVLHGRIYYTSEDLKRYGLQCVEEYKRSQAETKTPPPPDFIRDVFGRFT